MARSKKSSKSKSSVKVKDISPRKNAKGGFSKLSFEYKEETIKK